MPGTPFLYYGEELGMRNGRLRYRDLRDPYTKRFWPFRTGRDPARTPMQWDGSRHAGFSTERPWLPVSPDYPQLNVAQATSDPQSLWSLYRQLLHHRRLAPALNRGACRLVPAGPAECLLYERVAKPEDRTHERMLVAVNFSERTSTVTMPNGSSSGQVLLSTDGQRREFIWDPRRVLLGPQEGVLVRLT